MAHLDAALALASDGEQWRAHADADHESISSMFGGWTAAVLLRRGVATSASDGQPSALDGQLHPAGGPGSDVTISCVAPRGRAVRTLARRLAPGRRRDRRRRAARRPRWSCSPTAASPTCTCSSRCPRCPPLTGSSRSTPPGPQGQQTEIRQVSGEWGSGDTRRVSLGARRLRPALDHLQLAYLADQYAPRSFFWGVGMRPSATITCRSPSTPPPTSSPSSAPTTCSTRPPARAARTRRRASRRVCGVATACCSPPPNSSAGTAEACSDSLARRLRSP